MPKIIIYAIDYLNSTKILILLNSRKISCNKWPSPPGTFYMLLGKFSYFVIRFLLNSSIVKSDNEIGKVKRQKTYDLKI